MLFIISTQELYGINVLSEWRLINQFFPFSDPWQDLKEDYGKAGFDRITNLKKIYPHLKVSLAIGGWNEGSANYSMLTADPDRRKRFVKNASEFVR